MRALAKKLGLPYATFQREIKRGMSPTPFIHHDREYRLYSAQRARDAVIEGNQNRGPLMKWLASVAEKLRVKVLQEKKSPEHARYELIREGVANVSLAAYA